MSEREVDVFLVMARYWGGPDGAVRWIEIYTDSVQDYYAGLENTQLSRRTFIISLQ